MEDKQIESALNVFAKIEKYRPDLCLSQEKLEQTLKDVIKESMKEQKIPVVRDRHVFFSCE